MDTHLLSPLTPFFWRDSKGNVEKEKAPFRRQKTWMDRRMASTVDHDIVSLKSRSPDFWATSPFVVGKSRGAGGGGGGGASSRAAKTVGATSVAKIKPMADGSIEDRSSTDDSATFESYDIIHI